MEQGSLEMEWEFADRITEPDINGDTPVNPSPQMGRRLKRSNAIGLITIPSQAEKRRHEASENEDIEDIYLPEVAELDDDKIPKAKKKPIKPKTRELIKAALENHNDSNDNDNMVVSINTTTLL